MDVFAAHDDSSEDGNGELSTPSLDFTGYDTGILKFWFWNDENSGNPLSGLAIDISVNNGSTFNNLATYTTSYQVWTEITLDISSFLSNQTVIRFRSIESSSFYSDISIDDILVTAENSCTSPSATYYSCSY